MFIKENNLLIRNASVKDISKLGEWWRDGKVMEHAGFPNGLIVSNEEIEKQLLNDSDETTQHLIIEVNDVIIGEMHYRNMGVKIAQIGIKICKPLYQGKGYGTSLIIMLINYLFNQLDYSKIILDTNLNNLRAQHIYEKIGFIKVAVNYDTWKNQLGELQSSIEYELIKNDYI